MAAALNRGAQPKRPKDMTLAELDALPLETEVRWPVNEDIRPNDIAYYMDAKGARYWLFLTDEGWARAALVTVRSAG